MDLHPLFVHFPIALLTLYSFLEVIRGFTKAMYWKQVRFVLVSIGTLSAFVALSSGEGAEHAFTNRDLFTVLKMHSFIASTTTWIYAILATSYLFLWLKDQQYIVKVLPNFIQKLFSICIMISTKILGTILAPLLAIMGFIGLSLTGAMGAILVYGPDFDPITSMVYKLFFGG